MTTEAPVKPRFRRSDLLPRLMKQVTCCTPPDVRDWGMHAPPSFDHKGSMNRMFCNDCTHEYLVFMDRLGRCNRHELNGKGFEPEEDTRDFEEPA